MSSEIAQAADIVVKGTSAGSAPGKATRIVFALEAGLIIGGAQFCFGATEVDSIAADEARRSGVDGGDSAEDPVDDVVVVGGEPPWVESQCAGTVRSYSATPSTVVEV